MKALGLVVSDKKIFENCLLKTYFLTPWPTYATNWTLVEEHLGIIPVKYGQNPMSGFRGEVVWMKKLTHALMDDGQRTVTKAHSEHFVLRWAKKTTMAMSFTQQQLPPDCADECHSPYYVACQARRARVWLYPSHHVVAGSGRTIAPQESLGEASGHPQGWHGDWVLFGGLRWCGLWTWRNNDKIWHNKTTLCQYLINVSTASLSD